MTVAVVGFDRERLAELCCRFGLARLAVFGSVARGDAAEASDIDLQYELAPRRSLGWEIEDLEDELEEIFDRPVDLVSRRALNPVISHDVLKDAEPLYDSVRQAVHR